MLLAVNSRWVIKDITDADHSQSVAVIRAAFGTVARQHGWTEENVPRFPAFIKAEHLEILKQRGARFFGQYVDGRQVGFVAVEREPDGLAYMKRLAVLPEYRRGGLGQALVDTAVNYWRRQGEKRLHIGVAGDKGVLNDWYHRLGFQDTGVQSFPGLPFTVTFMVKEI